ncbi:hypothetical protein [Aquimarina mytili]|uniref:Uncharacterized protein n=1 Tax=Aquimarina mytili TaxID=874423 RepID=A0A937D9R8_9FLAO|nr:hypothetical protein [Aquimarina mytili]MBL0685315.1 hypothetical protein [Aquimarina mytili]
MKLLRNLLIVLFCNHICAQDLKIVDAKISRELDFGPEIQKEWIIRDKAMKDLEENIKSWDQLTEIEHSVLKKWEKYMIVCGM